jgi:RNA polymerase sigma-70 factor (ECF subfamily)
MSEDRNAHFPTTHWTLVARLRSGDLSVARRALEELLAQYRYTLYVYIRRRGLSHHDAEDALQDFLLKLLSAHALEDADEARGRLRGYLGTALRRFLANWRRNEVRRSAVAQDLNEGAEDGDAARYAKERFSDGDTPQRVFERKWGHALMCRVMERLKAQCAAQGRDALFAELRPVLLGGGSLRGHDAAAIAARLGMTEGTLRVALSRHLKDYRKVLEEEVGQTVENADDVADEIAYLMAVFSPLPANSQGQRSGASDVT